MRVRAYDRTIVGGREVPAGAETTLEPGEVVYYLTRASLEPVLPDLTTAAPSLVEGGVPIGEAWSVARHAYLDRILCHEDFQRFGFTKDFVTQRWAYGDYNEIDVTSLREDPPRWQLLRQKPFQRRVTLSPYVEDSVVVRGGGGVSPAETDLERLGRSLVAYACEAATVEFVRRLVDGELIAEGVPEARQETLARATIPSEWWTRRVILDPAAGDLFELMGRESPPTRRRAWSAITVREADVPKRVWPDLSAPAVAEQTICWLRVISPFERYGRIWLPEEGVALDQEEALWRHAKGEVERPAPPAIAAWAPLLPPEGYQLADAFRRLVKDHPQVSAWGVTIRDSAPIELKRLTPEPPPWRRLRAPSRRWRIFGRVVVAADRESWDSHRRAAAEAVAIERANLKWSDSRYLAATLVWRFLRRLVTGELTASGVWWEEAKSLLRSDIPAGWWERSSAVLVPSAGVLMERDGVGKSASLSPRWSEILIRPAQALPSAADVKPGPRKSGRPSTREPIRAACDRLERQGIRLSDLRQFERREAVWKELGMHRDSPKSGYGPDVLDKHIGGWLQNQDAGEN